MIQACLPTYPDRGACRSTHVPALDTLKPAGAAVCAIEICNPDSAPLGLGAEEKRVESNLEVSTHLSSTCYPIQPALNNMRVGTTNNGVVKVVRLRIPIISVIMRYDLRWGKLQQCNSSHHADGGFGSNRFCDHGLSIQRTHLNSSARQLCSNALGCQPGMTLL